MAAGSYRKYWIKEPRLVTSVMGCSVVKTLRLATNQRS